MPSPCKTQREMSQESSEDRESQTSTTTTTEVEEEGPPSNGSNNGKFLQVLVQKSPFCGPCSRESHKDNIHKEASIGPMVTRDDSSSPSRFKTYEIQVKNLSYKVTSSMSLLQSSMLGQVEFIQKALKQLTPISSESKYVLKNVSCVAKPGELFAIAGPSGAGKSTLLEILAGRKRSDKSTILVNNKPMELGHFRRISGYVMQNDALFPTLTVFETLMFSAQLRLPSSMPAAAKLSRVESLIFELGLQGVKSSRIGSESVRGISGGERRRVSIGVDVIHNPAVLLLDEPTSGLDSAGALQVVGMLHNMAKSHQRTIIFSVHQPSFRILQLIHSMLLLANGTVVHTGPLELLARRLANNGHSIPPQVNVVEYAIETIDLLEAERRSGLLKSTGVTKVHSSLRDLFNQLKEEQQPSVVDNGTGDSVHIPEDKPMFANSWTRETLILCRRFGKIILRTRELSAAKTLQAFFAGLALGTIFIHLGSDQRGVQERYGFFAFSLTFLLSATSEALPMFLEERQIFMRETSRGAYRVSSYVISNTLMFLPFLLVFSMLYALPTYWLVGLNPATPACLFFLLVVWLVVVMANSFVAFFSALVPNYIMGNTLISGTIGAFFLFSGYFISERHIPKYWLFMHYLSLFKYPLDAILINEYSTVADKCFGRRIQGVCTLTGKDVLAQSGLQNSSKWKDVIVMVSFIFAYRVICYIVLRLRHAYRQQ